jgi:hypothetical protein
MTGMGKDPKISSLVTVSPTMNKGVIYPMSGKSIGSIKGKMAEISKTLNPDGFDVAECEIHRIDNRNTAYCMLTSTTDGDVTIAGYGFADLEATMGGNNSSYAVAESFDEAYYEYLQINSEAGAETEVVSTNDDVTIIGTVVTNDFVNYGDEAGSYLISVVTDDGQTYWFLADGSSLNATVAKPGKKVTVPAYQRKGLNYLTVRYITVEGTPDFGGSLVNWRWISEWFDSLVR